MELLKILIPLIFSAGAVAGGIFALAARGTMAEKARDTWMTVGMPLGMCVGAALGVIWSLLAQGTWESPSASAPAWAWASAWGSGRPSPKPTEAGKNKQGIPSKKPGAQPRPGFLGP